MNNKKSHQAVFFISSGRSGTQWLCDVLGRVYSDLAVVMHEPLTRAYWPKRYLRHSKNYQTSPYFDELEHHLRYIETVLENRTYIETGWPCFPALPLLEERIGGRFKVVQLLRNPVTAAASLVTHQYYSPNLATEVVLHGQLEPFDSGTRLNGWAKQWGSLSRFEKCLFHWAEIHTYAEEFRQKIEPNRFLRIRSEDIFEGQEKNLRELTDFLEFPYRPDFLMSIANRVDKYRGKTKDAIDWKEIYNHEDVVRLAKLYGYKLENVKKSEIKGRYLAPSRPVRALRRLLSIPARMKRKYFKR